MSKKIFANPENQRLSIVNNFYVWRDFFWHRSVYHRKLLPSGKTVEVKYLPGNNNVLITGINV